MSNLSTFGADLGMLRLTGCDRKRPVLFEFSAVSHAVWCALERLVSSDRMRGSFIAEKSSKRREWARGEGTEN